MAEAKDDSDASELIAAAEQILANARAGGVPEANGNFGPAVKIIGASFLNAIVVLDNVHFVQCTFTSCSFVWNGAPFIIASCQLNDAKALRSDDPTIADALKLIASLGLLKEGIRWQPD